MRLHNDVMRLHNIVVGVALICCASASWAQERLTVDDAVKLALKGNYRLLTVEKRALGSHDAALSQGARLLPAVRLSEEYQHWDCPFAIDFMTFVGGCQTNAMQLVARKQDTNSFVAVVSQPLVGLLHTGFDYAAQRANAKAADAGAKVSEAQVVQTVRTIYLQYFEARALEEIAAASAAELADQVIVAQARIKAGVITNADLLRVQVAQANARQQQIAAHAQAAVAKANLLDLIGMRADANVELAEPTSLLTLAARPLPDVAGATSEAQNKRPEIAVAAASSRAAERTRTARYLALLPEVDAEGGYVRTDGQLFAPPNQWFVGVRASWNIWEWGASFFQARAASRQAEAVALEREDQARRVALDVQTSTEQTQAAAVVVEVAQQAIGSAKEAYRVTQALVQAGSATTTDLLDAQAAFLTARLNLARAQYELAIQRVAFARAVGE
ncbi:MAG: TolC family protein [Myxococcales bacterium]|nr:TolC family protein [Myxococcales bacterium]